MRYTYMGTIEIKDTYMKTLTPNAISITGTSLTIIGAVVVVSGWVLVGAAIIALGASLDMVDGYMARSRSLVSAKGAFIDSVGDRISDFAVIVALGYIVTYHNMVWIPLVFLAIVSSFLVSYTRARAESLGLDASNGIFQRPHRVVLLILGIVFHQIGILVLVVVSILSVVTVIQRISAVLTQKEIHHKAKVHIEDVPGIVRGVYHSHKQKQPVGQYFLYGKRKRNR